MFKNEKKIKENKKNYSANWVSSPASRAD
jgi:hypothetical protein